MPPRQHQRRKPFSGKQKKEQLKDKRKRKQGHDDSDDDGSEEVSKRYEDEYDPRKASSSKGSEVPLHVSLGRSGHVNKLSTVFAKETDNSVRQRKALATFPIDATARYMGTDDVHQILRLGNHDSEEWKSTMQGRVKDYHRQKQISKQLPYIHAANFAPHIRKHFLMGDADDDKQEQYVQKLRLDGGGSRLESMHMWYFQAKLRPWDATKPILDKKAVLRVYGRIF